MLTFAYNKGKEKKLSFSRERKLIVNFFFFFFLYAEIISSDYIILYRKSKIFLAQVSITLEKSNLSTLSLYTHVSPSPTEKFANQLLQIRTSQSWR